MNRKQYLLVAGVVVVFLVMIALFVSMRATPTVVLAKTHPAFASNEACSAVGCHDTTHTHKVPYLGACNNCHGLTSWRNVAYSHSDSDLNIGFHGVIGCIRCHKEGGPSPAKACATCHQSPHGGWIDCKKCHTPVMWQLPHPPPTGHLSLLGGHAKLGCFDCHAQPLASPQPRACVDCHGSHHGGLTDCGQCHDPARGWTPGPFDHSVFFKLTGKHKTLQCGQCHPGNRFAGTSPNCVSCHGAHHGGLTACAKCHTTSSFKRSTFRHSTVFNLSGGPHARLACSRCHPSNRYAHVRGSTCVGCHGAKHGGLTRCTPCHGSNGAVIYPFDHSPFFPLAGGPHAALACTQCHPGNNFVGARGKTCVSCHGAKHGGLTTCTPCHLANGAVASPITHPGYIRLGPAHTARPCSLCHTGNLFNAHRPCADCHTAPHAVPYDCLNCHRPTNWADIHFAHPDMLPHSFTELTCVQCHVGSNFSRPRLVICNTCHFWP